MQYVPQLDQETENTRGSLSLSKTACKFFLMVWKSKCKCSISCKKKRKKNPTKPEAKLQVILKANF